MSELRWWLLDDASGIRSTADDVRFDVYPSANKEGQFLVFAVDDGYYGPYRTFDTVFEAMKWAEEHYKAVMNPVHEDEER